MARVRRKANATMRWNFEIAGMTALGVAMLLGIALVLPPARAGIAGAGTAAGLHFLFGMAAALFPVLIAVIGAIVFLEINVPRMIASLGSASLGYFLVIDTAFGPQGGAVGGAISRALRGLVGDIGATIVLTLAAIIIGVAITNVSVKKLIGWCIVSIAALRARLPERKPPAVLPEPPATLREAFSLPAVIPKPEPAPLEPRAAEPKPVEAAVVEPADAAHDAEDDEDEDEDDDFDDDDDDDDDDEDDDGDDEDDDDEEEDDEDEDDDEDRAPVVVVGEYL